MYVFFLEVAVAEADSPEEHNYHISLVLREVLKACKCKMTTKTRFS
jgi:hypothetical protein